MWSPIRTQLSMWEWTNHIGLSPWFVAQFNNPIDLFRGGQVAICDVPLYQVPWLSSQSLARNDIAQAIKQAEEIITDRLAVPIAPSERYEDFEYPRAADGGGRWSTPFGNYLPLSLRYGKIWSGGRWQQTLIQAGVAISTTNPYSLTVATGFTATVTVPAGTTAGEIKVFYAAADRDGYDREDCEIKPLQISVSGTIATIKGDRYQLVKLLLYNTPNAQPLDASDAANFVTTFDVYRQTIDVSVQGNYIVYNDCDTPPCDVSTYSGCMNIIDGNRGWVRLTPATYDATTEQWSYGTIPSGAGLWGMSGPDRVDLYYIAGHERVIQQGRPLIDYTLGRATALLATALLPAKSCGCSQADQRFAYFQGPPNTADEAVDLGTWSEAQAAFGVMGRGAYQAYVLLKNAQDKHQNIIGGYI